MATRWTSKHTGQKIDDTIDGVCNPNLLDNWYFGNSINQRGQTEYTVEGYTIDRWVSGAASDIIEVGTGVITISMTALYQIFYQEIENPELYAGKTVTVSVLVDSIDVNDSYQLVVRSGTSSGQYKTKTITGVGLHSTTWIIPDGATTLQVVIQSLIANAGSISVKAVKLELGSQQTLAHQDADGNWVLNEMPDYGEQLAKCQRYYQVFDCTNAYAVVAFGHATEATVFRGLIPTFVAMRTRPTIVFSGESKSLVLYGNSSGVNVSSATPSVVNASINGVGINMSGLSLTKNETYVLQVYGCKLELRADL